MKKSHSVPLTKESHESLQEELKRLVREERPKIIQAIAEAREHGDLSENAEYDAAKNNQSFLEGGSRSCRISSPGRTWWTCQSSSRTRWCSAPPSACTTRRPKKRATFKIVGEDEADIKQGKISLHFAGGKALIGHKLDDTVKVKVPSGVKEYEIIEIRYE